MKSVVYSLLLCLLSALVEVHSQTGPYVSFRGNSLTNHSYVDLTLVGDVGDGSDSVQCHTAPDTDSCCSGSGSLTPESEDSEFGNWYFPNGTRLGNGSRDGIYEQHAYEVQRVDLRRRNNSSISGIYRCTIESNALSEDGINTTTRETVFTGLYSSGGNVILPSGIMFMEDSDLNGENPQFTLTCISTGGPATTVTWTRDSEAVSGGMTVLDDPVTANYTHTLTVTGRLGGEYQCSVSNNKPSTDTAQLTVAGITKLDDSMTAKYTHNLTVTGRLGGQYQCTVSNSKPSTATAQLTVAAPDPPSGLNVSQIRLDSVLITWRASSETVNGYTIYYQEEGGGRSSLGAGANDITATITVPKVTEGATYSISIVATSNTLPSNVTGPENITIEPLMISLSPSPSFPVAGESVSLTCNVTLPGMVSGTPEFQWAGPGDIPTHAAPSNSSQVYTSTLMLTTVRRSQAGKYTCTATLEGSTVNAAVNITVQRVLSASVEHNATNSTSLTVSWMLIGTTVTGYNISYSNANTQCFNDSDTLSGIAANEISHILTDLEEATEYTITVTALLIDGGTDEDSVTTNTMSIAPSAPPTSVNASNATSSNITVQWGAVDCIHRNGNITDYSVRYGVQGNEKDNKIIVVLSGDFSGGMYEISELTPSTNYTIEVAAENSAGTGEYSVPISVLTAVRAPVVIVNSSTAATISLSWASGGSVVNSYEVMWERVDTSGHCPDVDIKNTTLSGDFANYTIMSLEEDSSYTITVTAANVIGRALSDPVTGMTLEAAPSASPTAVSTLAVTSRITVQWEAVDCIHRNGNITGYSVRYGVQGSGSAQNVSVAGGTTTMATISGLAPSTSYVIEIAAINNAGIGVYSDSLTVNTSVAGAFVRFLGVDLSNHSYVNLSLVGAAANGSDSVQCHTDLSTCCNATEGPHCGDWYFPNGSELQGGTNTSYNIFESHQPQQVDLRYRRKDPVTSGIYTCTVETIALNNGSGRESIYVGIYASGGDVYIPDNITFTMISDCGGVAPEFTLTITSTGGPATTVLWTRDSEMVSGGATVLIDLEIAQYTHTLTVSGRLGGQYQCTVSNSISSSNSTIFSVKVASAPTNLMAVQEGPTSIRVSWTPPSPLGDTTGYRIYYSGGSSGSVDVSGGSIFECQLTRLQNGANYTISIVGTSEHLSSDRINYLTKTTLNLSPGQPSITVGLTATTTISLSWSVPTGSVVDTYEVVWERDNTRNSTTLTGSFTSYTVTGLKTGSRYTITVTATNAVGSTASNSVSSSTLVEAEESTVSSVSAGPIVGVFIAVISVGVITANALLFIWWMRSNKAQVRTKPLPQVRVKKDIDEDVEMGNLTDNTTENKDDNYFEDTSDTATDYSAIPVAHFPDHVKQMHQAKERTFETEYKSLDTLPQPSSDVACLPHNIPQNRFQNIFPYDHSRVVLKEVPGVEGSDYINASFIDGYGGKEHFYIASQGPLSKSVEQFWRMVWEYQLHTIVMLTKCVEDRRDKCAQYWPEELPGSITPGASFTITLSSSLSFADYEIKKLKVQCTSEPDKPPLIVTHLHYTAWPDHGVPQNAMSLISFICCVRKLHPPSLDQPLLVHCSAGVGRTGTFILLDAMMQQMRSESSLSVYQFLRSLRGQRMKMVQTQVQYIFIHDALSELVVCGDTELAADNIRFSISQLKAKAGGGRTGFQKQFQTLQEVTSQHKASCIEAQAEYNLNKNRFPDKLPSENSRVRLRHGSQRGSDYINASFVNGYKQRNAYIATQGPLQNTVKDFWRMMWEYRCSCIVMLCEPEEEGNESCCYYWPENVEESVVCGRLRVTLQRVTSHGDCVVRSLEVVEDKLESKIVSQLLTVTQMQLTSWPVHGLPHTSAVLSLIDHLTMAQRSSSGKPTVVMCSDGVGRTGTFLCIHSQLERLKTEGVANFFQAIKSARMQRPGLMSDAAQYAFCHEVVASYVDTFETYANFKEVM